MQESSNEKPVLVQPIFMWSTITIENNASAKVKYFPDVTHFPDMLPYHENSPRINGKPMKIRETLTELNKLQALDAADDNALKK
jgi:hypothetical protein